MSLEDFLRSLEDLIDQWCDEHDVEGDDPTLKLIRLAITENLKKLVLQKENCHGPL